MTVLFTVEKQNIYLHRIGSQVQYHKPLTEAVNHVGRLSNLCQDDN